MVMLGRHLDRDLNSHGIEEFGPFADRWRQFKLALWDKEPVPVRSKSCPYLCVFSSHRQGPRVANGAPYFKGRRVNPGNYKPVSLMSVVGNYWRGFFGIRFPSGKEWVN